MMKAGEDAVPLLPTLQQTRFLVDKNNSDIVENPSVSKESDESCPYTKCYCEENVWQQCRYIVNMAKKSPGAFRANLDSFYAVFISNHDKDTLFLRHGGRAHTRWDYHVVLLSTEENGWIWDLDSDCPGFPMTVDEYVASTFPYVSDPNRSEIFEDFAPLFRVVPIQRYLECFASDRTHMLFPVDANDHDQAKQAVTNTNMPWTIPPPGMVYSAPPPKYPPIHTETETMNLFTFVDMLANANSPTFGLVVGDCEDFKDWLEEQRQTKE